MSNPDVSVIIVNYNTKDLTIDCINSVVEKTKSASYEILLVDNASTDGSAESFRQLEKKIPRLKVFESKENLGFGAGNNLAMEKARGRYLLLLNSDTFLKNDDAISYMVSWMDENKKCGVSTCKLLNPDNSIQGTGGKFPTPKYLFLWSLFLDDLPLISNLFGSYHPHARYFEKPHEQDWITGAFMLIRREVFDKVGGFDTGFFMYTEDVEYCWRIRKSGEQIWYIPDVSIVHIGGASSGHERRIVGEFQGIMIFYQKHLKKNLFAASIFLKTAAILRLVIFRNKAYAKAFQVS